MRRISLARFLLFTDKRGADKLENIQKKTNSINRKHTFACQCLWVKKHTLETGFFTVADKPKGED